VQWEKDGSPNHCLACIEEQQSRPPLQRKIQQLPCPKHGHPEDIHDKWAFWAMLYNTLYPYSVAVEVQEKGVKGKEKYSTRTFINLQLLKLVCDELDISFKQAWVKLAVIEEIWNYG
jgi:hypothetical protein